MKTARCFLSGMIVASLGFWTALPSQAQEDGPQLDANRSYQTVSYRSNEDSASDSSSSSTATKADENATSDESTCRWCRDGKLSDPWTLPQPASLKNHGITAGGWIEGGILSNQYGAQRNGPLGFEQYGDGFKMNQLWGFLERKTNTDGCGWDVGGRVDYLFGTDGPYTQAFGDHTWDYGWNSSRDYGSAIPQAYVEVAYNNLTIKGGRFYTSIGYEVVPATGNFFYSHSYQMFYAEPFTHTGMLATYKANDVVTVFGGWVNGWDEGWQGADSGSMFLGGVTFTFSERTSLTWATTAGRIGTGRTFDDGTIGADGDVYMNSLVFTWKLTDKLTYVLQHDLGTNYNIGDADAQWYGLSNYLLYKLNDCWGVGGRFEWFQDPQGARVVAGNDGNYYELTAGLNYKPHANVTLRPEIRYDWYNGSIGPNGRPFNDGSSNTQLSGGFDFIFTF
ncbi:MAG: porin [Planctomycetaceae bacterium]|nr:porin [Planctomycetaceae bacterium]